jgi:hypothetical protein
MMLPSATSISLALLALARASLSSPSAADWEQFSKSLNGRLLRATPIAAPCFSVLNGNSSAVDPQACAAVQAGYTVPDFRSTRYAAYMLVRLKILLLNRYQIFVLASMGDLPASRRKVSFGRHQPLKSTGYVYSMSTGQYFGILRMFKRNNSRLAQIFLKVAVSGPGDVQETFSFSQKTSIHLSIKASGHDYKGRSSSKGSLNIWVGRLFNLIR